MPEYTILHCFTGLCQGYTLHAYTEKQGNISTCCTICKILTSCNDRHILKALVPLIPNLALLRVVLLNQSIKEKLELKTFLYTHITQFFHQILTSSSLGNILEWSFSFHISTLTTQSKILTIHFKSQISSSNSHASLFLSTLQSFFHRVGIILSPRPQLPTLADTLVRDTLVGLTLISLIATSSIGLGVRNKTLVVIFKFTTADI